MIFIQDQAKVEGRGIPSSANMDYPSNKLPRIIFGVTDLKSCAYLTHGVLGSFISALA